jgi:hypothetical protein
MTVRNSEVTLTASSTTFASSYTVSTTGIAVSAPSPVALTNYGAILSSGARAIDFGGGGVLVNAGLIDSTSGQIEQGVLFNGPASVVNSGVIEGNTGVQLNGQGSLWLTNAATIIGQSGSAIWVNEPGSATIVNSGLLLEKSGNNYAAGGAVIVQGSGIVTNSGTIISQHAGGVGEAMGVELASGTVVNAGVIEGATFHGNDYAIDFTGSAGGDSLILDPGQTLDGIALAHGAGDFITLGGIGLGTLSNPGNYIGWTLVSVGAGADWQIGDPRGAQTFDGISAIAIGTGAELAVGGPLESDLSNGPTPTAIDMEGNGEHSTLDIFGPDVTPGGNVPTPIRDFGSTDTIIIGRPDFDENPGDNYSLSYAGGVLTIDDETTNGTVHVTIAPASGPVTADNFAVSLTQIGAVITDMPCFAAGTRILTPEGETAVEDIRAGAEVLTCRDGRFGVAEVVWAGQRSIDLARHAMPEKVRPVRICAGAFGPGLPQRDLRLSPDHALYIDGHLIEAKTLVNGVTVIVETGTRDVTYHHIELARHDVVLAEGLPAESYLDSGNRTMFESGAGPLALHPDFAAACRARACAQLLTEGAIVIAARQRLLDRAEALGFAVAGEVDLVAVVNGEPIRPTADADGEWLFVLPAGAASVALLSSAGVPAEVSADPADRRVLGVDVAALTLIAGGRRLPIDLGDASHEGFYEIEGDHRWTNGAARIRLPDYAGRAVLEVAINGQAARWSRKAA